MEEGILLFFLRQRCPVINKEPLQLGLFIPYEDGYDLKVIVTNKWGSGNKILAYHNGSAVQESFFGELKLKSQC